MDTERYQIGSLLLNAGTQEVTREGEPVPLPPLSFSLLLTLARSAPNVVTTAQLEEDVWSGLVIDRGTINKRVVLVRNALREAGCTQDYIIVVRGTGYRLSVPVQRLDESATNGHGPAPDMDVPAVLPEGIEATPASKNLRWMVLLLLMLVLGVIIGSDLQLFEERADSNSASAPAVAPGFSGADSIAVMPFGHDAETGEDTYFAEGISRELVRMLSNYPGLDVAASASSFALRDSEADPAAIADQLGVDTLLQGSVHREGERILVMASLLHAPTGRTIWADSYDHPVNELFQVQDAIASRVAVALRIPLDGNLAIDSRAASTGSIEAYTLYLKGRGRLDQRLDGGAEPILLALEDFRAAARLDPAFVRAHVGLASASFLLSSHGPKESRAQWLERAEASARYALDLDPGSAEALGVLAAVVAWRGDPMAAAGLFERAMERGIRDPDVLHWHAMLATSMGYFESLLPVLRDAYRLDPLNQLLGCSLAGSLNFSGRPDEAMVILSGMDRFSRRDLSAAVASLYLNDWNSAREFFRGLELRMGSLPPAYADLLVEAFENPPRRAFVEQAFLDGVDRGELLDLVAFEAMLIMGSPRAFDLEVALEGSYFEHRLPEAVWHNWGVALRQDPRFKGWVRSLGFDRHWRKYGWPDRCRPTGLDDFECV